MKHYVPRIPRDAEKIDYTMLTPRVQHALDRYITRKSQRDGVSWEIYDMYRTCTEPRWGVPSTPHEYIRVILFNFDAIDHDELPNLIPLTTSSSWIHRIYYDASKECFRNA